MSREPANIVFPAALPQQARIGIVTPAGHLSNRARMEQAQKYLESRGHQVHYGAHFNGRHLEYLAGSDAERRTDLLDMFADDSIDAIFCARGGYGVTRLLRGFDFDVVRANPKILLGFSDITALNAALFTECGLVSFSGSLAAIDLGAEESADPLTERSLWAALHGGELRNVDVQTEALASLYGGRASGRLICGTLSLFASLCGTPWFPDMRGKVILLEDVGEQPYAVDRMLCQLFNSGAFDNAAGLAFGAFTGVAAQPRPAATAQPPMMQTLNDWAARLQLPCVHGVQYGHIRSKLTLPFGAAVELNADECKLRLLEHGVRS